MFVYVLCVSFFIGFHFIKIFTSISAHKMHGNYMKKCVQERKNNEKERKGKLDLNNDYGEGAAGPSKCDFLANRH